MLLIVGRIGRVHGVRGEVTVEVRTDSPEERFEVGTTIATDPPKFGPLTITGQRWHNGILLLTFEGVSDRGAAEKIKNVLLMAEVDVAESDSDEFHVQLLIGSTIELTDGTITKESFSFSLYLTVKKSLSLLFFTTKCNESYLIFLNQ